MLNGRRLVGACFVALLFVACSSTTNNYILVSDPDASSAGGGKDGGASLGPQCEAYLECCHQMSQPASASCADIEKNLTEGALDASFGDYETACERALTAAKNAGLCSESSKADAAPDGKKTNTDSGPSGVCKPNCATDLECQQ